MSAAWSWYVIALVVLNIAAYTWLLWWTARRRPGDPAPEETSHVWDEDITEYNKPLPKWWINLFYLTIVFSIGYLVWYPGMGSFAGVGKWTSVAEHDADAARSQAVLDATFARFRDLPIDQIAKDPEALRLGRGIFANTCSTCHGSDAKGARGFPNLTDADWQWGGTPDDILNTVLHGRQAVMPPFGEVVGGTQGATEVAVYVQSLSGMRVDPALAAAGKAKFDMVCTACHGADGTGNPLLGAPNLTDDIWLYGSDFDTLRNAVLEGHNGAMPAHEPIIGEMRARLVAAWVWAQSHGGKEQ
ncbi:cytochrome-c oxidase, cbb3-type subunit III [Xanthomonadaceae bacterium JHOS43]|nr:cytochrome-c oxidase, cbb3-type subunit III [Xanthomonadaceae bacterium JHOS43]MCX7562365.1 cytochrome-c oxidase, cbb3-type subunit III [Xanthomonadaceae bacterium XH05]